MTFLRAATNGILGALPALLFAVLDATTFGGADMQTAVIVGGTFGLGVFVALFWGPLV